MKKIIVTGPARGLGLAISQRLTSEGYQVIGIGRKNSDAFTSLERSEFIEFDLEHVDEIHRLVKKIKKEHGAIYGLVNNAGLGLDGVLATMHASEIRKVLNVNLLAAITMTKYVSRSMLEQAEGRIVNISSIIASTGYSGLSVYAASKAGLEGFTRSFSREVGKLGICVNCVAPGYMETDMTAGLEGDKLESVRRRAPKGLPRVEDAAGAVFYLLSPDGEKITGSVITVDGGATA
ncbi:MAG: SDR family NAD(P)-dependent oxidoreductase [Planctomycetota bacterium]